MRLDHVRRVLDYQAVKAIPIFAAVLERYGILATLRPSGSQHVGPCPVHQGKNKRQFVCDLKKGLWKCFGDCANGALSGGSTIDLVSALERIDARAAAERISDWFAIVSPHQSAVQHRKQRSIAMSGNKPTHKVFAVGDVPEGSDEKPWFTRIGAAWPHKSGKGLNIELQALPINHRLVLFEYDEEDHKEEEAKAAKYKKK